MSDFDKEAEREKLRKKYERDEEKREATQRMSELLLQGATMTNTHCDDCGDPIFRYDGQEFCPTCQAASVQTGDTQTEPDRENGARAGPGQAGGAHQVDPEQANAIRPESDQPNSIRPESDQPNSIRPESDQPDASGFEQPEGSQADSGPTSPPSAVAREDVTTTPAGTSVQTGDLTAARESLVRTVQRYAEQAERADDPRRAKDALAAAREAAETLAVLDR